jgi:hypothetical protein
VALRDRIRYWMRANDLQHRDLARVWGMNVQSVGAKLSIAKYGRPITPDELEALVGLFRLPAAEARALHRQAAIEHGWKIE